MRRLTECTTLSTVPSSLRADTWVTRPRSGGIKWLDEVCQRYPRFIAFLGLEATLIIKLGNRLVRAFTTDRTSVSMLFFAHIKTVTSAGHDEERIGAFVSEGKAAHEQSTDAVPTQAADTSARQTKFTLRVTLKFQKARLRRSNRLVPYQPKRRILQPRQANFILRVILPSQPIETTMRMSQLNCAPGGWPETEQVIRAAMPGLRAGDGVMGLVGRHLPVAFCRRIAKTDSSTAAQFKHSKRIFKR